MGVPPTSDTIPILYRNYTETLPERFTLIRAMSVKSNRDRNVRISGARPTKCAPVRIADLSGGAASHPVSAAPFMEIETLSDANLKNQVRLANIESRGRISMG